MRIIKVRVDAHRANLTSVAEAEGEAEELPQARPAAGEGGAARGQAAATSDNTDGMAFASPWDRYHIAKSQRDSHDMTAWVCEHEGDPAFKVGRWQQRLGPARANAPSPRTSFRA